MVLVAGAQKSGSSSAHGSSLFSFAMTTSIIACSAVVLLCSLADVRRELQQLLQHSNLVLLRHGQNDDRRHGEVRPKTRTTTRMMGWEFAGPTTYVNQFGKGPKLASAGAVQKVVQASRKDDDDSGGSVWFLGSVNGGVWRATSLVGNDDDDDVHNPTVHWENVLDGQAGVTCSSISALHVSSLSSKVYAGCGGSTSSEQGSDWNVVNSGDWGGIMVSSADLDEENEEEQSLMMIGTTWRMLEAFPVNYYVTDILEVNGDNDEPILLVSAQSHLFDRNDGGIWRSRDGGESFEKVHDAPTFTMSVISSSNSDTILATHARSAEQSISISTNGGQSFHDYGRLPWNIEAEPFYTCATQLGNGQLVVAGLTRLAGGFPNNTDSQFFISTSSIDQVTEEPSIETDILSDSAIKTTPHWIPFEQPTRMDQDSMPKDRMALLADPEVKDLMYVAGNAGSVAWRVNVTSGAWTKLWDPPDVMDGSILHVDCRNFAWDDTTSGGRLLLVSDGGIFAREQPRTPGGRWISLNGDYSSLELLSAHYDPRDDRYVMGAQDNSAIITNANATSTDVGYGFVEGDGTVTAVDSQVDPSRLYGTTQFLGVGVIENDPKAKVSGHDDDDDADCGGLCFAQGDRFVEVELTKYFADPSAFPFFVHPYALNRQDPTLFHVWTNGTRVYEDDGEHVRLGAFYQFHIPYTVQDKDDIEPPTLLAETPPGVMVMDFISGGYNAEEGKDDPTLLLGISNTHLYVGRHSDTSNPTAHSNKLLEEGGNGEAIDYETMTERPLPVTFAEPVTLQYDPDGGARILGPLTHAKTVFMAVASSDSRMIVVTGWSSVADNKGDESIFLTTDTGMTWHNITGNMRQASGVVGKVRPGGLLLMDLDTDDDNDATTRALMVGTSDGILITFLTSLGDIKESRHDDQQQWIRLGTHSEFPIVLTADIDYEPISDRLVAATFGRGIFVLKNAKERLLDLSHQVVVSNQQVDPQAASIE